MKSQRLLLACLPCLIVWMGCSSEKSVEVGPLQPIESRSFYMGFTPFPSDITIDAVVAAQQFAVQHGDLISHHLEQGVPWTEALSNQPYHEKLINEWNSRVEYSKGKKIFLSLNALNDGRNGLAMYRGEKDNMPLPEAFVGKALNDPDVKTAYLNFCRRAIETFKPDYFAIGIEVNELIHNAPDQWPAYKELYLFIYQELKAAYPDLPLMATVSLHNLTNKGWKDLEFQQKEIKELLESIDILGISFYPFMAGYNERPVEQLQWLREFTDKPIAISETGYLAETLTLDSYNLKIPGSQAKQLAYIETLLDAAQNDDYLFVVQFLTRDYDALWNSIQSFAPEAFKVWRDTGMEDERGVPRPALQVWDHYHNAPYKRTHTDTE
ncbi:MAG: glycosyl hydrolase 53 family protein [Candidatus Hinthialibacter antarcticus]|nr:glycosyl hydrolase 53 family protein [Candidatus Hinthialibacter antarcticus]